MLLIAALACAPEAVLVDEAEARVQMDGGLYTVQAAATPFPFQTGAATLDLAFTGVEADLAVVDATVAVTPWMPDHGHGVSEDPVVEDDGLGLFTASWEFSMPGTWELTVEVDADLGQDRVVLSYEVEQVLLLALVGAVQAGACCVGATATVPTRLGECERWIVGTALSGEQSLGRWDSGGDSAPSSLSEQALIGTLAAGMRIDRAWQLGLRVPAILNHKTSATGDSWGGGPGDLRVHTFWDPLEERADTRLPVPVVTLGLRAPTGRGWARAEDPLMADVTGLGRPGAFGTLGVERTLGRLPWSLTVDGEVDLGKAPRLEVGLTAAAGAYLGTRWSLLGHARHGRGLGTARTTAGLRLSHGVQGRSRIWADLATDLPLDGLGQEQLQLARAGLGFALVR